MGSSQVSGTKALANGARYLHVPTRLIGRHANRASQVVMTSSDLFQSLDHAVGGNDALFDQEENQRLGNIQRRGSAATIKIWHL